MLFIDHCMVPVHCFLFCGIFMNLITLFILSSDEQDGTRTHLGVVWAPTQDGGFYALKTELYLPEMPHDMRQQGNFERVPAIIGINAQDGAEVASMYSVTLQWIYIR